MLLRHFTELKTRNISWLSNPYSSLNSSLIKLTTQIKREYQQWTRLKYFRLTGRPTMSELQLITSIDLRMSKRPQCKEAISPGYIRRKNAWKRVPDSFCRLSKSGRHTVDRLRKLPKHLEEDKCFYLLSHQEERSQSSAVILKLSIQKALVISHSRLLRWRAFSSNKMRCLNSF